MPTARVKVMRSYDYCHFEVELGSDDDMTLDQINHLRKQAAVLVDESVRQYKEARERERVRGRIVELKEQRVAQILAIKAKPRNSLTPEEAALLRDSEDESFWKSYNDGEYCYDDTNREHHFSMLEKFKKVFVSGGLPRRRPKPKIKVRGKHPVTVPASARAISVWEIIGTIDNQLMILEPQLTMLGKRLQEGHLVVRHIAANYTGRIFFQDGLFHEYVWANGELDGHENAPDIVKLLNSVWEEWGME